MPNRKNKKEWWQVHFNENYLKTYIDITPDELTKKQVKFLIQKLNLKKRTKLLDLACGYGRHAIPLAEKGFNVLGFDYSKEFIDLAKRRKKELGLKNVAFVRGDMRKLQYRSKFDVVINMFTSFAYFKNEHDNLKVLKNIYRSLKPHGQFLIDTNNSARSIANMIANGRYDKKKKIWELSKTDRLSNGLLVKTTHGLNFLDQKMHMSRFWKESGKLVGYDTVMRAYSYPDLKFMLEIAGFKVQKVWGDYSGKPLTIKSRRMIILAEK